MDSDPSLAFHQLCDLGQVTFVTVIFFFFFFLLYAGLSLLWPLPLRSTGSGCAGSAAMAHGPSHSAACGIFPDRGTNPHPLHRQADSQPLRHQGSPSVLIFKSLCCPLCYNFPCLYYIFRWTFKNWITKWIIYLFCMEPVSIHSSNMYLLTKFEPNINHRNLTEAEWNVLSLRIKFCGRIKKVNR